MPLILVVAASSLSSQTRRAEATLFRDHVTESLMTLAYSTTTTSRRGEYSTLSDVPTASPLALVTS